MLRISQPSGSGAEVARTCRRTQADLAVAGSKPMTLVLSAIGTDAVVMVADRKLSWRPAGRAPQERNKLVVYRDRFAFAFSGLAEIEGLPVDGWLARGLRAEADLEAALCGNVVKPGVTQYRGITLSL